MYQYELLNHRVQNILPQNNLHVKEFVYDVQGMKIGKEFQYQ